MNVKDNIIVGTSGYVFPDWAGTFYPRGLSRKLWMRYYIKHFNALELNTTFYAVPKVTRMVEMAKKLPENFSIHIKLPRTITHQPDVSEENILSFMKNFYASMAPLVEKGVVKGYLAQFPVSFRPDDDNLKLLLCIITASPKPLFVEFRNSAWMSENTEKVLADYGIGWVVPDAPQMNNLMPNTTVLTAETGYIRLHGRNEKNWYSNSNDRYDYNYSDDELGEIFNIARELLKNGAGKVFVYFNNCHQGQAALNAKKFAQLIGLLPEERKLL